MNNIIIGTAGHVDHGKSSLIRALTGIETDRLSEERRRGITIELGFAWLDLEDGLRAGIVDVPGHERFIKNMLAGAGGVDLALLVIAADEGIMPQTTEHLHILSLLGIHRGLVVITKSDMVEPDWLEMVTEDVREFLQDTFLKDAPILPISSLTGDGIPELKAAIAEAMKSCEPKASSGQFRLAVDRVFTMEGFGTVVTGTLVKGNLQNGSEVMIFPGKTKARVRGIQVHGAPSDTATAGQRVAINLTGIKRPSVDRGDVIAPPDSLPVTMMLDVRLSVLPDAEFPIKNASRLHFYQGADESLCKVVLLGGREELLPGESGYAQLRFEEEVSVEAGDRFVVRFYSPLVTVGGGVVLNPLPRKHRRQDAAAIHSLEVLENGSLPEKAEEVLRQSRLSFLTVGELALSLGWDIAEVGAACEGLSAAGALLRLDDTTYLHRDEVTELGRKAAALLSAYHKENPLRPGMRREELRTRLIPTATLPHADAVIAALIANGLLKSADGAVSLAEFSVTLSGDQQRLREEIEAAYRAAGFSPPATTEFLAAQKDSKAAGQVMSALLADGVLIRLDPEINMHADHVAEAEGLVLSTIRDAGGISLGETRDRLSTSRKFAIALLELFDRKKLTKKSGDVRVLFRS